VARFDEVFEGKMEALRAEFAERESEARAEARAEACFLGECADDGLSADESAIDAEYAYNGDLWLSELRARCADADVDEDDLVMLGALEEEGW